MQTNTSIRTFIGIPIPEDLHEAINAIQLQHKNCKYFKWVKKENLHITLKFLGQSETEKIAELNNILNTVAQKTKPFTVDLGKIKLFPNIKRPIALAIEPIHVIDLTVLAIKIDQATNLVGFKSEKRPYRPHVTLAKLSEKIEFAEKILGPKTLSFEANNICLYQSTPTESGSKYEIIKSFAISY